jgi:hypothetical protein
MTEVDEFERELIETINRNLSNKTYVSIVISHYTDALDTNITMKRFHKLSWLYRCGGWNIHPLISDTENNCYMTVYA